jgi:hypothetical protein
MTRSHQQKLTLSRQIRALVAHGYTYREAGAEVGLTEWAAWMYGRWSGEGPVFPEYHRDPNRKKRLTEGPQAQEDAA